MRWLLSLCVVAALAGCATTTKPEVPPESLLWDCKAPPSDTSTNGKLAGTLLVYKQALKDCNDDKATLRKFYELPDAGH